MLLSYLTTSVLLLLGSAHGFTSSPAVVVTRSQETASYSTSKDYVPPAFSVEDDDDDEKKKPYIPPAFSVEGEEQPKKPTTMKRRVRVVRPKKPARPVEKDVVANRFNDDSYDKEESSPRPVRPSQPRAKRAPRPPRQEKKMSITNWMEKNERFTGAVPQNENGTPSNNNKFEQQQNNNNNNNDGARPVGEQRLPPKTFRQDFRGTRVFVQGIPPGISWQDMKDHFRVAGDVVFASVSVDPTTGQSKGHGIVQFETTEMAKTAIEIMRDHPLNGSQLFVRPDVKDEDSRASLRPSSSASPMMRQGMTTTARPNVWKCANEDNVSYMNEEELEAIKSLIKARDDARRRKKYEISDQIREELKHGHGVFVDDRLKMWWTSIDGSRVPQTIQDIKGDGRWGNLTPWRQIPTTPENDMCVDPDLVEGLLKQRDVARREKDFGTADALLEEARASPDGDLELRIHDESRTWRIWTEAPPPKPVEHRISSDPIEARKDAAKQCIAIVQEVAPQKTDEIKMLLRKFPGREFQMLKRLKNQYQ